MAESEVTSSCKSFQVRGQTTVKVKSGLATFAKPI